jgi:hypothetical protein
MDPVSLLLTAGPSILRGIGSLFGGKAGEVADQVANVADAIQGKTPAAQRQAMQEVVDSLPPEAMVELKKIANEASRIQNEAKARAFEHTETIHHDTQETARIEAVSTDEYVRRTRPGLARKSFWAGSIYGVGMELASLIGFGDGANIVLLGGFYAPMLEYIGARSIDAFSKHKGPKL